MVILKYFFFVNSMVMFNTKCKNLQAVQVLLRLDLGHYSRLAASLLSDLDVRTHSRMAYEELI